MSDVRQFRHLAGKRNTTLNPLAAVPVRNIRGSRLGVENMAVYSTLFETSMEAALNYLPPALHPSLPATIGITFYHAAESDLGTFRMAVIGLGCRSGIKPRMLTLAAFASTDAACSFFAEQFGYPIGRADVRLEPRADSIRGSVLLDGHNILEVLTLNPADIVGAGAMLKISAPVNHVGTDDGDVLLQTEIDYNFKRLQRGNPRIDCYDEKRLCSGLRPTWPIVGALAAADVTFQPTRYLLSVGKLAEEGGVTNLGKAK